MAEDQVFSEFLTSAGSASDSTLYTRRVKEGRILHVQQISAVIYTTNYGDYTTAKYIAIGIEKGGVNRLIQIQDMNGTYGAGLNLNVDLYLAQGDRIFVKFEATATTTVYEAVVQGVYVEGA